MRYRSDIDGLRAVAVLPVVLFHAGLPQVSGGFVGVDVFFVISGFLMTTIIAEDVRNHRFTLLGFYERRIRRIFPALFAVLCASSIAASVLMLPSDLMDLARSALSAALFTSNLFFWRSSGDYFALPAETKPLLHTWSLGVEEQFYILLPLCLGGLLFIFQKSWSRTSSIIIIVLAVVSFILSIWGMSRYPFATFYMLPTRAWELLVGSAIALGAVPSIRNRLIREAGAATGLGLILWSVVAYSPETPFPGLSALVPVIGTGLLIHLGEGKSETKIAQLLSLPPVRFVGLISYSLYLWHWPILVFAKYASIVPLHPVARFACIAASVAVASVSWRYIEQPFRRVTVTRAATLLGGAVAIASACAIFMLLILSNGLPQRLPAEVRSILSVDQYREPRTAECDGAYRRHVESSDLCVRGVQGVPPAFLLVGDSHAGAEAGAVFDAAARVGISGVQLTDSSYRPVLGFLLPREGAKYRFMHKLTRELLSKPEIRFAIVVVHWSSAIDESYLGPTRVHDGLFAVERGLLNLLTEFPNKHFLFLTSPPMSSTFGWSVLARSMFLGRRITQAVSQIEVSAYESRYSSLLRRLDAQSNGDVLDITSLYCRHGSCLGVDNGALLFLDEDHLTARGASRMVSSLAQRLQGISCSMDHSTSRWKVRNCD